MSHHSSQPMSDDLARLLGKPQTGATGVFPRGKISPEDEGEIQMAIAADPARKTVLLDFGKPVVWIGMTPAQAVDLGSALQSKAAESGGTVPMALSSHHWSDSDGRPQGGAAYGVGFAISWQNGPLGRGPERQPPNGAFVEHIIAAAIDRLEYYQKSPFASGYNAAALAYLKEALASLNARTASREERGVEGTHDV